MKDRIMAEVSIQQLMEILAERTKKLILLSQLHQNIMMLIFQTIEQNTRRLAIRGYIGVKYRDYIAWCQNQWQFII